MPNLNQTGMETWMIRHFFRDQHNNIIGSFTTSPGGTQTLYDINGIRLGEYTAHDDVTRDRHGIRMGMGNLLAQLLPAHWHVERR